jgi:ABC-type antimicrobial peptide transport system permease subunit
MVPLTTAQKKLFGMQFPGMVRLILVQATAPEVMVAGTLVLSKFTQWPTLFSVEAILIAFFFSRSVGVFFGFYPARKASMLNPIEALHYE